MKCMADVCVIPIGEGVSVAEEVTECERILRSFPIDTQLHPFGTALYGEWDDVFAAIKACHEQLHDQGVVRISSSIRVGTRTDKEQTFADKMAAVNDRLGNE